MGVGTLHMGSDLFSNPDQWGNPIQNTWYEDTAGTSFSAPIFEGKEDCDTLIIGGGLAGLALKSMLSEYQISCILLEENTIASGASGMNGGFCTPGWSVDQLQLENWLGVSRASQLYSISLAGFQWMKELCQKIDSSISQIKHGVLKACSSNKISKLESKVHIFNEKYEESIHFLKKDELLQYLLSPRYDCGLLDLQSFQFNPLNVMRSLAFSIQSKTGKIFENSKATDVGGYKGGYRARTFYGGVINAKRLVFCTGGYFSNLGVSSLNKKLFSLQTSIGVTQPLGQNLSGIISNNIAIHDNRRAGNYFRILPDRRLLWGRDIRAIGMQTRRQIIYNTKEELKFFFPKQAKIFDDIEVDYGWSGKLGYSSNLMPYLGFMKPNLFILTGFGGHGMNTAPAAASLIRDAILGNRSKMQIFEDFIPTWNGGVLGRYAAEMYIRWLKICDQINMA